MAVGTILQPYRLRLAGLAVLLQIAAHVVAGRRGRRSPLLWVGTAGTLAFVTITLLVGARMGMVL